MAKLQSVIQWKDPKVDKIPHYEQCLILNTDNKVCKFLLSYNGSFWYQNSQTHKCPIKIFGFYPINELNT